MKHRTIGARMIAALLPLVCAAGFTLPASADYPPALVNAVLATEKAGSYHMEMTMSVGQKPMKSSGDVQSISPMKMRMTSETGDASGPLQMVIIAPDSYMKMGNAGWKKYAGTAAEYGQMDINKMFDKKSTVEVTDLGMRSAGGQMMHAFKAVDSVKNSTQTIYLDSAGRLARIELPNVLMIFTNYGESVNILAPM